MNAEEGVELFKEDKARSGDVCRARKGTEENAHLPTHQRSFRPNLNIAHNRREISQTQSPKLQCLTTCRNIHLLVAAA